MVVGPSHPFENISPEIGAKIRAKRTSMPQRGVTLAQLRRFRDTHDVAGLTTAEVVRTYVKPETARAECSYADLLAHLEGPAPVTRFVSHSWSNRFEDLVDALGAFELSESFWICAFAMNQHRIDEELGQNQEVFAEALLAPGTRSQVLVVDRAF